VTTLALAVLLRSIDCPIEKTLIAAAAYTIVSAVAAKGYLASGAALAAAHPVIATGVAATVIHNVSDKTIRRVVGLAAGIGAGVFTYKVATGASASALAKSAMALAAKGVTLGATFAMAHPYLVTTLALAVLLRSIDCPIEKTLIAAVAYTIVSAVLHPYIAAATVVTLVAAGAGLYKYVTDNPEQAKAIGKSIEENLQNGARSAHNWWYGTTF
jgi:hypothetical protein